MDYLTRKSVAQQYGSVGVRLPGGRFCKYPCLAAIGVRDPSNSRELTEAIDDLALDLHLGKDPARWRPEEIEAALAKVGTPKDLGQKTHDVLTRIAATAKLNQVGETE